jgi:hypothetical protein
LSAAAAIASNSSTGITQLDADAAAASGAGTTGASVVAGAGLPAKADVAAIAKAVARAIFSFCYSLCNKHAYLVGHDLLQAQRMFNLLCWCQFAIISYTLEKLQRLND